MKFKSILSSLLISSLLLSPFYNRPEETNPAVVVAAIVGTAATCYGIVVLKHRVDSNFETKKAIYEMLQADYQKLLKAVDASVNHINNQQQALVVPNGAQIKQVPVLPPYGPHTLSSKAGDYHRWYLWHDNDLDILLQEFYTNLENRNIEFTEKSLKKIFKHLFW